MGGALSRGCCSLSIPLKFEQLATLVIGEVFGMYITVEPVVAVLGQNQRVSYCDRQAGIDLTSLSCADIPFRPDGDLDVDIPDSNSWSASKKKKEKKKERVTRTDRLTG